MKNSKLHLSALMVITIMAACTDEPMPVQLAEQKHVEAIEQPEGMMQLGPQLANPYALSNMQSLSNRSCFWIHAIADRECY